MSETAMDDLRRRCDELTREFNEKHPAKAAANRFVRMLSQDAPGVGEANSQQDRQHQRAADELYAYHGMVCDMFAAAPIELEEVIFKRELRLMMAAFACGMHSAPEGQTGRDAHKDAADRRFTELVMALQIYLSAHPELEMKRGGFPVSRTFADLIRGDLLDAMGLPRGAKEPSVNQIVDALRAIKNRSLSR
jgi:hypothetical protein